MVAVSRTTAGPAAAPVAEPLRERVFAGVFARLPVFTILFEDTEVEERFFGVDEDADVLSVAAAGCGIAAHLARHPRRIDAVDTNPWHLGLTALKVAAATHLDDYDDFLALFGRGRTARGGALVERLAPALPAWAQRQWRRRRRVFTTGLHDHGLLAQGLRLARAWLDVDDGWGVRLCALSLDERRREVDRVTRRLLDRFLVSAAVRSPLLMLTHGINFRQRDKNLASAGSADMRDVVLGFVQRLAATDLAHNWIYWHTVVGRFDVENQQALPHYLRRSHHARSRGAPTTTTYHQKSFVAVLNEAGPGRFSHFSFSDALDWLPDALQAHVLREVVRTARDGAVLLNRSVDGACLAAKHGLEGQLVRDAAASDEATAIERSGLYRRVDLYRVVRQ